ncbi:MAG: GNAT family N-acetyltransferase [Ruminococcus sp.]|nr:GNAT family N-acetyltransferase [Ruminococcus sp.]
MNIVFEQLNPENFEKARAIDRSDIPENFVDTADTIMDITNYGLENGLIGHTYLIRSDGEYIGLIMIGEALVWDTDPPQLREEPFYRLMGFVLDKKCRGQGIGGEAMEKAIDKVYEDFGVRPIILGCHKDNTRAAEFYIKHGFKKTEFKEGNDVDYLRYPKK